MPTSNYNGFERWLDDMFGSHIKTYVSTNSINTKNEPAPVKAPKVTNLFEIQSVLSNRKKNAFTVVWTDGTSTVVHCQPGDEWDDEKALAMCFTKKALGNKGNFNDKFNDALDNKMKVIPGGAGIIAKEECDCDGKRDHGIHSCTECKMKVASVGENRNGSCLTEEAFTNAFGVSEETAGKLSRAAAKADVALKDMINALTGETIKVQRYNLFLMDPCGDATEIYHQGTDEEIHKAMRAYRMKHYPVLEANRTPYRVWMIKDNLMVDFGAGSYFMVPGMDHDTFVKGK
jgi:hypothetical protein